MPSSRSRGNYYALFKLNDASVWCSLVEPAHRFPLSVCLSVFSHYTTTRRLATAYRSLARQHFVPKIFLSRAWDMVAGLQRFVFSHLVWSSCKFGCCSALELKFVSIDFMCTTYIRPIDPPYISIFCWWCWFIVLQKKMEQDEHIHLAPCPSCSR